MKCFMCGEELEEWKTHFDDKHRAPAKPGQMVLSEEMGVQNEWYRQAKDVTLVQLPEFLRHLLDDYRHDYGTICHALAAGAVATAWAMNGAEQGGITRFQAGAVMWQFIQGWSAEKGPMRLLKYRDMLFPQYADHFEKRISFRTMTWLKEEARKMLAEKRRSAPEVREHWTRIAEELPPFGYTVDPENS